MRYIVLSFDDGLLDFKENALPILNAYNMKASLNIISGYTDKTIASSYKCLSIGDIKELYDSNFEIANHTDSHLKHGSFNDFVVCNRKINKWCKTDKVLGVVMPKYSEPNESALKFFNEYKPPYISYAIKKKNYTKNIVRRFVYKLIYMFKKDNDSLYSYEVQIKMYKKNTNNVIQRIEVGKEVDPYSLYRAIKHLKNNYCLTLVFHSITDEPSNCPYPPGAWTIENFTCFCKMIGNDKDIMVIKQIEAFDKYGK